MVFDDTTFGTLLKEKRPKAISQGLVARTLEVKTTTVRDWEKGTSFPKEDKLPIIAQLYGIEMPLLRITFDLAKEARRNQLVVRREPATRSGNHFSLAGHLPGYAYFVADRKSR